MLPHTTELLARSLLEDRRRDAAVPRRRVRPGSLRLRVGSLLYATGDGLRATGRRVAGVESPRSGSRTIPSGTAMPSP